MKMRAFLTGAASAAAGALHAAETAPARPAYSPAGSILQMLVGLAAVLLVMWLCARLLKRYGAGRQGGAGIVRVLGGVAVGQRERVVMVEIGDKWMLLGVAPGRVNALHVMDKMPGALPPEAPQPASAFAASLARFVQRRER